MKIPELLMPAGTPAKLMTAIRYGADAVYAGIPRYSLRSRKKSFNADSLRRAVQFVHDHNKKIYFTANIVSRNAKVKNFLAALDVMQDMKPDAYIMSDPGLIHLARKAHPDIEIHLSVQANTMNWAAADFWYQNGVSRIILSRELHLGEIEEIKKKVPGLEIEVFVHGAICIAHSGRCLLSNYYVHRDANQGTCNNACRNNFHLTETTPLKAETKRQVIEYLPDDDVPSSRYFVEDDMHPGEYMEVQQDEHGTYFMNAKDLNALEYLPRLVDAGVDSIKVEGRTKSNYYVALVSRTYRKALDQIAATGTVDLSLLAELDKTANRGYTPGFLDKQQMFSETMQQYDNGYSFQQTQYYAGDIIEQKDGLLYLQVKNRIRIGDTIEIFKISGENLTYKVDELYDQKNRPVEQVSGGLGKISINCPYPVSKDEVISVKPADHNSLNGDGTRSSKKKKKEDLRKVVFNMSLLGGGTAAR